MSQISVFDPFVDVFPELLRGIASPNRRLSDMTGQVAALKVRIDVTENERAYLIHADMPGVNKEDIDVQIDGAQVSISAKSETRKKEEGEKVLRTERYAGTMSRSFTLASEIDENAAQAKFENGVLELNLPKKEAAAARRLAIN